MRRSLLAVAAIGLLATPVFAVGPSTGGTTASSSSTLTVTVPGIVGVDVESNADFDFTTMTPAAPTATCAQSANHWPISINCAVNGSGNVVYLPTNDTSTGTVAPAPVNATTAYSTLTATDAKGLWLALFCSKSGGLQPTLTASLGNSFTNGAPVGYDQSNFYLRRSTSPGGQNGSTVGYATDTAFPAGGGANTGGNMIGATLGAAGATFGWTRADQVVTFQIPNNSNIGDAGAGTPHAVTMTFTITK